MCLLPLGDPALWSPQSSTGVESKCICVGMQIVFTNIYMCMSIFQRRCSNYMTNGRLDVKPLPPALGLMPLNQTFRGNPQVHTQGIALEKNDSKPPSCFCFHVVFNIYIPQATRHICSCCHAEILWVQSTLVTSPLPPKSLQVFTKAMGYPPVLSHSSFGFL